MAKFAAPVEWRDRTDEELRGIQSVYAAGSRDERSPEHRAWCLDVARAVALELHERAVLGRYKLPYTFSCRNREATVSFERGGFRVRCSGARQAIEVTRAVEAEAFVVARSWAFAGVMPREARSHAA